MVLAGSPLRLFRTTPAGSAVLDRLADGDDVEPSVLVDRLLDAGAIHPCHTSRPPIHGVTVHDGDGRDASVAH